MTASHGALVGWLWAEDVTDILPDSGEPLLRTRGMIGSCSVFSKAPKRQLHSNPIAVSGSAHVGKQIN